MAQFFKFLFASCLGFIVAMVALFFIGGVLMVRLATAVDQPTNIKPNSVLKLTFSEPIPEHTNNLELNPYDLANSKTLGVHDIIHCINTAKEDDNIKGIYFAAESFPAGVASASMVRDALVDFKESGKFIVAYSKYYSQGSYYLASVADKIIVSPIGLVDFRGFAAQVPFYKNMLDKVGINMQIFYAGKFKSATEPFRRTSMSPESKLQVREYMSSMYDRFLEDISGGRQIPVQELRKMANDYIGTSSPLALENRLIDEIGHSDLALSEIRNNLGFEEEEKIPMVGLKTYFANNPRSKDYSVKDKIAVVYAEGTVVDGKGELGTIGDDRYVDIIRNLRNDSKVKAIVLRVNSGGGSALSSENIWRELSLAKENGKKIVVSMGDYAASGGYYIACMADSIFAQENTLTGSIGVFSMIPSVQKLFNDKLGINYDTVKTAQFATGIPVMFDMNDPEKQILQLRTDEMYEVFLKRVSEGRGMSRDEVHAIAQGRVWTGTKAAEIGLVDRVGGLEEAISSAADLANLDAYRLSEYPKVKEPLEQFLEDFLQEDEVHSKAILKSQLGEWYPYYQELQHIKNSKGVQARLPFIVPFN